MANFTYGNVESIFCQNAPFLFEALGQVSSRDQAASTPMAVLILPFFPSFPASSRLFQSNYLLLLAEFTPSNQSNTWLITKGTLMDDTSTDCWYQPGQLAHRLFYTIADGEETDPDTAIAVALDGDWERLEPDVVTLLGDESAGTYDRFLAMTALARWGSPTGYEAVRAAAEDPEAQPWRGMSIDRLHSLDNTFALLTESVASSRDEALERGTSAERLAALAALISIADQVYFEHNLSRSCLNSQDIEQLLGPIEAQIERGLAKLAAAQPPLRGWVDDQVEELIDALRLFDKSAADTYKARLVGLK